MTDPSAAPADLVDDRRAVAELLGREPEGDFSVVVRRADGRPVVIRNHPLLRDGTPMPTRWWLVDADLRRAVSGIEAGGGVREATAAVDPDELERAHARYAAERDAALPSDHDGPRPAGGVGGTRRGVKCLHAHYAWFLAGGDDPVGRWVHGRLPPGLCGPNAEAGLCGPNAEAGLCGPNAEAGLRGPNAEAGLRGPNAEAGLRGPNAEAGLRGPNAVAG